MARLLVIDDENNIRTMIRLALQFVGHEVETAADGEAGLTAFGDGTGWDLVLLDQRMPGMDGLQVLRTMRERRSGARIMMITAFGTIDLAYEAMRAGAVDFLRKPFTTEILRGAVQAALQAPLRQPSGPPEFAATTINGFRIEKTTQSGEDAAGMWRSFDVQSPAGDMRRCRVVLPQYLVELINEHTRGTRRPQHGDMWQMLGEEVLANYVWQHSEFPPQETLRVDEVNQGLRRWIDAVLADAR